VTIDQVYIVAPANVYTGGPTALHQLCRCINSFSNVKCLMAYYGALEGEDPVHPEYKKYGIEYVSLHNVEDTPKSLIIVPEVQTFTLRRFVHAKKAVYWLSVDNFFLSLYKSSRMTRGMNILSFSISQNPRAFVETLVKVLSRHLEGVDRAYAYAGDIQYHIVLRKFAKYKTLLPTIFNKLICADLHIAQSKYTDLFLKYILKIDWNRVASLLGDPLEDEYLNMDVNELKRWKLDVVTFDAKKAFGIIYRIARILEEKIKVKVIPLKNVGKKRMLKFLSASKVFLGIGHHPGKDRPPREAAALGNIVLINRSGGYHFYEDVPIPDEYTIYCRNTFCKDINIHEVADKVIDIVRNYEDHLRKFEAYIRHVKVVEPLQYLESCKKLVNLISQL